MPFSNSLRLSLFLLAFSSTSFGALYTSPSQLPQTTFDYVVIGAGTAGNVVANRLSENQNVTVLVLEAGVSNENVTAAIIPLLGPSLVPNTLYDFNYTTTPQTGYNNRVIPYSRGRLLGGSSSANYMVYTRGSSDDYDRYAKVTGDSGWGWNNIKQYIQKHEKFVAPADNHDTSGQYTPADHGTSGLLQVSLPGFSTPLDDKVIATTKQFSSDFPFIEDNNGGDVLGVAWSQASIGGGARSSSATAYLSEDFLKRPNLHVLINAQVTKLVQTENSNGLPTFHGVEFASKPGGPVSSVKSTKETILSAGTFGSAIILQLSGIGDKEELDKHKINTIVNIPSVGKNLTDHPLLANVYSVKGTQSYDGIFRSPQTLQGDIGQWINNKTGPLTAGVCNHLGFFRLPADSELLKDGDPSSGPKGAHMELIFSNLWVQPGIPTPNTGSFLTISTTVMSPTSRGYLQLSSDDPWAKPIINPNFLSTDFDKKVIKETIKLANRFVSADAWKDYVIGPYGDFAKSNASEEALDAYIANNAATFFHPIGTAMMSPKGAQYGVVDPNLKVKGVEGLRVIDGAVLPYLPSGHTQAAIYLVAERGADLVKADNTVYGGSTNSTSDGKNSGVGMHSRPDFTVPLIAIVAFLFSLQIL